jgi:hypothetical protein
MEKIVLNLSLMKEEVKFEKYMGKHLPYLERRKKYHPEIKVDSDFRDI